MVSPDLTRVIRGFLAVAGWLASVAMATPVTFVLTSDLHYGLSRSYFRGTANVSAAEVNSALADAINALPQATLPADGGVGAGTAIGAVAVAKSPADGHSLLLATSTTLCVNPVLRANLPYQVEDFAPVAAMQLLPFMVLTPKELPVTVQLRNAHGVAEWKLFLAGGHDHSATAGID